MNETTQPPNSPVDALDKATQAVLLKTAAAAGERGWKLSDQKDDEYLKELGTRGMTVDRSSAKLTVMRIGPRTEDPPDGSTAEDVPA